MSAREYTEFWRWSRDPSLAIVPSLLHLFVYQSERFERIFLTVLSTIVFRLAMEALEGGGILKKYLHVKRFPRLSLESKLVPGQYREYCGKTGHHFRRSKVRSFLSGVTDSDSGIYRKVPKPFRKS